MSTPSASPGQRAFATFALDLASGELRKDGQPIPLPRKAFEVLKALLERPGEVITREELRTRLWPADTFVEFDDSLNHAVKKLRQALGDSAEAPRFIGTVRRCGYRLLSGGISVSKRAAVIRSIAVLPLANLCEDPREEYFADGMTDALITDLSRIRSVKVISRTSVMQYKHTSKPLPQIGRELKVDGLIEGTIRHSGGRVQITVQLMHAVADSHLWTGTYARPFRDILELQNDLARAVTREIQAALTTQESVRLARACSGSAEAYEAYLKGQFHWYKFSPGHLDRAFRYFQFALEKDPGYALAHVGIANTWLIRAEIGTLPPQDVHAKARAAALSALQLDETLGEAHVTLGNIAVVYDHDWALGEREFRRAIEIIPNSADAHFMYADFLISMKRVSEWLPEMQRVLELDPLNPIFQSFYGWHLVYLRRYDEAIGLFGEALAADPDLSPAHMGYWGALCQKGMQEEALAEARKFFAALGDAEVEDALKRGYAEGGYSHAMQQAAETLVRRSRDQYVPSVRIARLYAHSGEKEPVLEWLQRAYIQGEGALLHLNVAWDWDLVRDEPRFRDLVRRLGLPRR